MLIKGTLTNSSFVIPAKAGIQYFKELDYSLPSLCVQPCGRSTRYALLSGLRRNDELTRPSLRY